MGASAACQLFSDAGAGQFQRHRAAKAEPDRRNAGRVNLRPRADVSADGTYGFRLVATSGAGLSDDPPRPGSPADFRVQVDTTVGLQRSSLERRFSTVGLRLLW